MVTNSSFLGIVVKDKNKSEAKEFSIPWQISTVSCMPQQDLPAWIIWVPVMSEPYLCIF